MKLEYNWKHSFLTKTYLKVQAYMILRVWEENVKINPSFEGLHGKQCFQEPSQNSAKLQRKCSVKRLMKERSLLMTGSKFGQKGLDGQGSGWCVIRLAGLRAGCMKLSDLRNVHFSWVIQENWFWRHDGKKTQDTVIKDHGVAGLSCSCRWDGGEAIVSSLGF